MTDNPDIVCQLALLAAKFNANSAIGAPLMSGIVHSTILALPGMISVMVLMRAKRARITVTWINKAQVIA